MAMGALCSQRLYQWLSGLVTNQTVEPAGAAGKVDLCFFGRPRGCGGIGRHARLRGV